jgi:uncharacterized protein (TIGR03437 family)
MRSAKVLTGFLAACGSALFCPAPAAGQQYIVSTIAGTAQSPGWSGDNGPATSAQFTNPIRVALDKNANFYITDYSNQSIRMVNISNYVVNSIAGNGSPGFSGDNVSSVGAQLTDPHDVVVDPSGNVYIADTVNARVRKIDTHGIITTVAGNGTHGYSGDGGAAVGAQVYFPTGLALDKAGNLYIADFGNATVRKVATNGIITTIAGLGYATYGVAPGDGGYATAAALEMPYAVQVDSTGVVYIGDTGSSSIRRIGLDGKISTYVTNFIAQNFAIDSAGALYFANYKNNTVEKVLPGGTRLVIAGDGISGFGGDGGPGLAAQFNQPYGVAVDAAGNVYVADAGNAIIRELTPVAFSIGAVANAANLQPFAPPISGTGDATVAVAPGEIVVLFGAGLGPSALTVASPSKGFFPTTLAGVTVSFNGVNAPIYYVSSTIVAAIVPYELFGHTQVPVSVTYQGKTSQVATVTVAATAPGIFTADASGSGQAAAINQDGTLNSASNPAPVGTIVTFYGTGEGQTTPAGVDGKIAAGPSYPSPLQNYSATVNGLPAVIDYLGAAPTLVAGALQFNVEIPTGVPGGSAIPVVLTIGGVASQTVTIAVSNQ